MNINEEYRAIVKGCPNAYDEYEEGNKIAREWFFKINKIIPCQNYTFTRKVKKWDYLKNSEKSLKVEQPD